MIVKMSSLYEMDFKLKVTRVRRESVDRLMELASSEINTYKKSLLNSLDSEIDIDAFHYLHGPGESLAFSMGCLAILHCYSLVENNRKLILRRLVNLSNTDIKNLHKIEIVNRVILKNNIIHENISSYDEMELFRKINNSIKHNRYNFSKSIDVDGVSYQASCLVSLYQDKSSCLEVYLESLYQQIMA